MPNCLEFLGNETFDPSIVPFLPASIQFVEIDYFDDPLLAVSDFPANVRELSVFDLPEAQLLKLPPQLQKLVLQMDITLTGPMVEKLPRKLL